ncbi:MAG TPA: MraY family glycosyltransferase [Terriglobales bacterium]|nr:MraY family glycosyltransferase [Terriglobales bacterium]
MAFFYLGMFAASLLLSFILTRYIRDLASTRGWVAIPGSDRHLHRMPLPRLGGVAIFLAFLFTSILALLLSHYSTHVRFGFSRRSLLTIMAAGFLIFLLGVYDDIRTAGPYVKFSVQAIAATMLYAGNLRILNLPVLFGSHHFSSLVGLPLTILWVLAITNAFNLIDGLDGLAAGSALFSTIVVFTVALLSHSSLISLLTLSLAGAILGFLRFNFNPATIFLGDCGSLFIGFMLSALALLGAQKSPTIIAVAIPVVSFGLPILETTLSVIRRFISGRPVFTADREHIHHKLLQLGFSHRQVVITLYAVSALFALLSLFLLWPTGSTLGLVLAVVGTGIWMGVQHLGYLEFGELRRVAVKTIEQRQIFINNLAIRRAAEELKVAKEYDQVLRILSAAFGANDFDAVELHQQFISVELSEGRGFHAITHRGQEPALRWKKSGSYFSSDLVSAWNLTIDLVTSHNRRCGSMTFYRRYDGRDLQLDINLLTSIFQVALADGLERISSQTVQYMPPLQDSSLIAAQVS